MVTPDTRPPTLVIEGQHRIATYEIGPDGGAWAEAWTLRSKSDVVTSKPIPNRTRLCRLESDDGLSAVMMLTIDEWILRDARAAGLPDTLASFTPLLVTLPAAVKPAGGVWLLRMLARKAVRDLPIPIEGPADRAVWMSAIDVLADIVTVNPVLTAPL